MAGNKRPSHMKMDLTIDEIRLQESSNAANPGGLTTPKRRRGTIPVRNLPDNLVAVKEISIFKEQGQAKFLELQLHIGGCVEIENGTLLEGHTKPLVDPYFIRITKILTCNQGQYITGNLFKRARHGYGLFDKTAGEVFWIRDKVTVSVKHIVRTRELILTNHTDLTCGGILPREDAETAQKAGWEDGEAMGRLICRRKAKLLDNVDNPDGSAKHVIGDEGFIRMLEEFEADDAFRYPRTLIRDIWMADKVEKITKERKDVESKAIDLVSRIDLTMPDSGQSHPSSFFKKSTYKKTTTSDSVTGQRTIEILRTSEAFRTYNTTESRRILEPKKTKYTFGDFFCGAGGASCGARLAGLQISYGIDNWKDAITSYERNYGKNKAILADICKFAANPSIVDLPAARLHTDVIHLSCPCQFYSPVHTNPGKNDEMNEVASFVVDTLLKVVRPRIVTSEQTFGLNSQCKFRDHFAIVINQYVRNNYSVRWAVKDATDYGAASARKRLIVIASCPGEPLPNFPGPTSFNPFRPRASPNIHGLPTTPTIGEVLASIPENAANHILKPYAQPKISPFNINLPFNKTITCDGGESTVHPNGKRPFTLRELAAFQTFPSSYKFSNTCDGSIKRQIGNAWPPNFARAIYESIVKHLERIDDEESKEEIL